MRSFSGVLNSYFLVEKFPKVVLTCDLTKAKFTTQMYQALKNYWVDEWRKGKRVQSESLDKIFDTGEVSLGEDSWDKNQDVDRIINLMTTLEVYFNYLVSLRSGVEKKLAYHCKIYLGDVLLYDDGYVILNKLRGIILEMVAEKIESKYTKCFGHDTTYMKAISSQIKERGESATIFLEDVDVTVRSGKQKIAEWIKDINKSFARERETLINSIY